jgi:hypothetical protein
MVYAVIRHRERQERCVLFFSLQRRPKKVSSIQKLTLRIQFIDLCHQNFIYIYIYIYLYIYTLNGMAKDYPSTHGKANCSLYVLQAVQYTI